MQDASCPKTERLKQGILGRRLIWTNWRGGVWRRAAGVRGVAAGVAWIRELCFVVRGWRHVLQGVAG